MDASSVKPILFVLSGPPGAGKSSNSSLFLPTPLQDHKVFDGDETRMGLEKQYLKEPSRTNPVDDAAHAGNVAFTGYVSACIKEKRHIAFDRQIHDIGFWRNVLAIKDRGYQFQMAYVGLEGAGVSAARVQDRISSGGHWYVEPGQARRCYHGNLEQLNQPSNHDEIDRLVLFDNTTFGSPKKLVVLCQGKVVKAAPAGELPKWIKSGLPVIFGKVQAWERQCWPMALEQLTHQTRPKR